MLDATVRPWKDRLLRPLARALGDRVHPDALTALSFAAGLAAAGLAAAGLYRSALALWLANRILDGLDGVLARMQRRTSDLGGYLDLLADFVVYAAIPLGLVLGRPPDPALALAAAFMLGAFYLNATAWLYLSAILEKRGRGAAATGEQTAITMPGALVEGTETFIFYAAFLVYPEQLTGLFTVFGAMVLAGAGWRIAAAVRSLR